MRYDDRVVRLSDLSEVDILVTYWAGKSIAHIMVSFGFGDKEYLAVSIETRKEKGESYSAVNGFFRTLTTNCTTQVLRHVWAFGRDAKYNWQILLSGYVPEYLYENDTLMPGLSLDEIMERSLVNSKAHAVPLDENFSRAIRVGVPQPPARGRGDRR